MRLDDSLDILDAAGAVVGMVDAHVGTVATMVTSEVGAPVVVAERLTALVEPDSRHKAGTIYKWRGESYTAPAQPVVRRRGGEDHHYTLTLERGQAA